MLRSVHILGFHIPMYSLMLALGLLAFFLLLWWHLRELAARDGVTFRRILLVGCAAVPTLGIFAFLFDALFHSIEEGRLVFGGITWLGGVVGAIPAVLLFTHFLVPKRRGYELETLDAMVPGIALGHAFGRVGCFLGGCCFGKVSDSVLAVSFPEGSPAAKLYPALSGGSLPVLPTQLFEAVAELVFFVLLLLLARVRRGKVSELYAVLYGGFRFCLEFLRGDERGATGLPLSPAQLLSLALVTFGILLFLFRKGLILPRLTARLAAWRKEADALPEWKEPPSESAYLLWELYTLKEKGAITEEEYEEKKKDILSRL